MENMFSGKIKDHSFTLNKLFGRLALYAPDDVYLGLNKIFVNEVIPNIAKPKMYYVLRKSLFGDETNLTENDFSKHINATPLGKR